MFSVAVPPGSTGINRSLVELKPISASIRVVSVPRINRSLAELKPPRALSVRAPHTRINRSLAELKHGDVIEKAQLHRVSIAPWWS